MQRKRSAVAFVLCASAILTAFACGMGGLDDGFTLDAFDFGTSPWWHLSMLALFGALWAVVKLLEWRV